MRLTSYLENGQLTVVLCGEIDHHCAKEFMKAISGKLEAYSPKVCILDYRDVAFMDSSGIAVAINAMRQMSQLEGKLMLTGLHAQPMKVLKAAGIDKLMDIKEVS